MVFAASFGLGGASIALSGSNLGRPDSEDGQHLVVRDETPLGFPWPDNAEEPKHHLSGEIDLEMLNYLREGARSLSALGERTLSAVGPSSGNQSDEIASTGRAGTPLCRCDPEHCAMVRPIGTRSANTRLNNSRGKGTKREAHQPLEEAAKRYEISQKKLDGGRRAVFVPE